MRINFTINILLVIFISTGAEKIYAQHSGFAKTYCGNNNTIGNCITEDANGKVYVTGRFYGNFMNVGTDTLANTTTNGYSDIFIAKYDSTGNVMWLRSAGGTSSDFCQSVCVDAGGNAYITGYFNSGSIIFGSDTLANDTIGSSDIFISKYDGDGNVIWAKRAGGKYSDVSNGISTDAAGNIYITGNFGSSSVIFGNDTLLNSGSINIFIAKYDSSGNAVWAKRAGGTAYDYGNGISTDAGGYIYVTGAFYSAVIAFGNDTLINANTNYTADIFIAEYDSSGNLIWVKGNGGTATDYGNSIGLDANGNVYVTGYFGSASIVFGNDTLQNDTSNGSNDFYAVKLNSSGNAVWAKSALGNNNDLGTGIRADAGGNVYVSGYFKSPAIIFGSDTLVNDTLDGSNDVFIVKYDSSGNLLWTKRAGGTGNDYCNSIFTDENSNLFVAGYFFSNSIIFGSDTIYNTNTNNTADIFVAKINDAAVGVHEQQIPDFILNIFPNPGNGKFTVQMFSIGREQAASLEIYNLLGEKIYPSSVIRHLSSVFVDISNHPKGIYFIQIKSANKFYHGKIIVD